MTVDYDVVIIGGSSAGRYAALSATQLQATVALVEPQATSYEFLHHHALTEIGKLSLKLSDAAQFGIHFAHPNSTEKCATSVQWAEAMQWATTLVSNLEEQHSPATLAAQGIDIIIGSGQFESSPHLGFAVNNRLLRARSYLIATGSRPAIPEIEGLESTGYLTLSDIWQSLADSQPPSNWVILGGVPESIQLAQTLTRFGCKVTLVVEHPYILPRVDPDLALLLQAQLEAEGVRVLTQTSVIQVRRIDDKKWVQAGDKAIETDEIVLASGQQPNIQSLNLEAVGVKRTRKSRLWVNNKLQTTNRRIYACGEVIGGFQFANFANYEARIALKNALFFPLSKVDYRCIPWSVFSHPMLAQVGVIEGEARHRYNDEIIVLRQYFKTVTAAQLTSETTGICKLIVLGNGEILGGSVLGPAAGELINVIALAMAQKIKVSSLADLSPLYPSFSEMFEQMAQTWSQKRLSRGTFWQNFLESFFHFRRSWNL